jgi:hypothetical protein
MLDKYPNLHIVHINIDAWYSPENRDLLARNMAGLDIKGVPSAVLINPYGLHWKSGTGYDAVNSIVGLLESRSETVPIEFEKKDNDLSFDD